MGSGGVCVCVSKPMGMEVSSYRTKPFNGKGTLCSHTEPLPSGGLALASWALGRGHCDATCEEDPGLWSCRAVGHPTPAGSSSYRGRQPSVSPRAPLPPSQGSCLGLD